MKLIRKYNLARVRKGLTLNPEWKFNVTISFRELLEGIDAWVMATGKYLIVDPLTYKHF